MNSYEIEKALSGWARCKKCKRKIPKNTTKLIILYRDRFQRLKKRDYCKRCGKVFINRDIRELNKDIKGLNKILQKLK